MALMDYLKTEAQADAEQLNKIGQGKAGETGQSVPSSDVQASSIEVNTEAHRPSWMTDDDYKEATLYYSPERIGQLYKGFDTSSSSPFYQDLYKSTIHKPSAPDEKKIKAARNIAGVADALSLITQGISGFSGGYIPRIEASAQRENNAYTQRLRDIYKAENDRYSAGLYQSTLRDIESARQGYDRDRSGLLGVIQASMRLKSARGIAESKNAADMYKFGIQQEGRRITGEEQSRHNKAMEGIASRNADSAALRASKSGKSGSSTSTPRGYTDWYNPNTGYSYRLKENNIKAFVPQIFKEFEKDVFKGSSSEKMRYKALSPSERYNYVQAHWADSPSAVAMIEKIAEGKEGNGKPVAADDKDGIPPILDILMRDSGSDTPIPYRPGAATERNNVEQGSNQKKSAWR